jgi:L-ascorbate metabolism protein UlaG (beta-lactamase superfamily)
MNIRFLGHATLEIKIGNKILIVDPFISGNPKQNNINVDQIKADYILLTHAHQDHTLDVEKIANKQKTTIISNFEVVTYYQNKGFQGHPMNHGGAWTFDFGYLKYVNAIHTSSFADGSYGGQPGGFVLTAKDKSVYIAGDTALTYDMKLIGDQFDLDLAILPIGDNFTMGIDDAVLASDFVKCNNVLGYHYDTFGFIEIDHNMAKKKFSEKNKNLTLLEIGEELKI